MIHNSCLPTGRLNSNPLQPVSSQMFVKLRKFLKTLGPGIITGASDDDPSGIATYSIAGSKLGFSSLWAPFLTFPLMVAIQEMCARIGLVTGKGLAGAIAKVFPKPLLWLIAMLMIVANMINIGADLSGMAAATRLIINIPHPLLAFSFSLLLIVLIIYFPYHLLARYLKWLTISLFAYIFVAFNSQVDWFEVFRSTIAPNFQLNNENITIFVALLGTTISPYLFFWQTSEEVEERKEDGKVERKRKIQIVTKHELRQMREDVSLGMLFSNVVMYFIILTTAATLHKQGITSITQASEVAGALKPIAGDYSYLVFTLGIIGTGLLAIPVLAGSAAYAASEAFGWKEGLDKPFAKAKAFYGLIILATLGGAILNAIDIRPVDFLFYTAVIYGLISPILILIILVLSNNKNIMGDKVNGLVSNTLGITTFLIMTIAVGALFLTR